MTARASPEAALISIHDVMPETLAAVDELLSLLLPFEPECITLLVVPGSSWEQHHIDWLHRQQRKGHALAGHGWLHRCAKPRTLYHALHSLFLSRNVAEHLSLMPAEIYRLVVRCYRWFAEQGLHSPTLYVPPAWAMGNVDRSFLKTLPFQQYETLRGVYHAESDIFDPLPLTGYEADTRWRAAFLRAFNDWQRRRAVRSGVPLRIGLHPHDLRCYLATDLREDLQSLLRAYSYRNYRQRPAV